MGSPRKTSWTNAATDNPKLVPIASMPTFRLDSPNQRPAIAIVALAKSGKSGIKIYATDIEFLTYVLRNQRPTDAAVSFKKLTMGSLHSPKTMMAADVNPILTRRAAGVSIRGTSDSVSRVRKMLTNSL